MRYSEGQEMPGVSDLTCEVTREQGPIRALVSFNLQRNLHRARLLGNWLRLGLFRLTGWFHTHFFLFI